MLILLSVVNQGIGACFVGAFQDNKVSEILEIYEMHNRFDLFPKICAKDLNHL